LEEGEEEDDPRYGADTVGTSTNRYHQMETGNLDVPNEESEEYEESENSPEANNEKDINDYV
jgi:hypothetical protein